MKNSPIASSIGLLLIVLLSAALIGWLAYGEEGAVTETYEVGTEGIKKAQEVKELLELQNREYE